MRSLFRFWGRDEHLFIETNTITHGSLPSNNPFSGHNWYGIENIKDKIHKISLHKDRVCDTKYCMMIPVMTLLHQILEDDLNNMAKLVLGKT